jgi:hypothetical protein
MNNSVGGCTLVVYGDSSSSICRGFLGIVTSPEMTSSEVNGSDITGSREPEPNMKGK